MATTARPLSSVNALILLLAAAVFLNYVDRGAIGVAAPLMKDELRLSATAFGIAVSAFFWVYAPVQLIVGWLCDRFSVYPLLATGVAIWAAATLLMGFAGGVLSLVILRIMLGVGESFTFPATSKIIARHVPAEGRGLANAAMSMGIALGPAAGTLAGGLILASLGWRAIFIAFGIVTLLWLVPWLSKIRGMSADGAGPEGSRVRLGAIITRWPLWSMSIAHIASNFGFYFILTWLPLYLVQSRGLSVRDMTMLATLGYLAQAVAALAFGVLSDRWTRRGRSEGAIRRWMMIAAQLLAAISILGIAMANSIAEVAILLCLAGIATGSLSLNIYAVAQMFAGPRVAGTWIGVQNAVGNLSGIFGPIATGIIVDRAGYDSAFVLAAAVALFGAIWWALAVPRIRQVELTDDAGSRGGTIVPS